MGIPAGYRNITSDDVGKIFGVDLEPVIEFDNAISVGNWYINAEPPFDSIEWMSFSDSSNFYSSRGGNPGSWMIDTYFRGSTQSMSEGSYPNPYDTIVYTSETVPSGTTIMYLWTLDTTWMNYVYVKDKEPDPEYTITFDGRGGSSPSSQTTTNQKLTTLPSSTKIGYKFLGWYTSSYGGTIITTSTVFSTNRAVWAQWTLEDYKINFYDYNNVLVESFIEQYYGESITLPTPPTRPGYTFDEWYDNRIETTYHLYNGSGTQITWTTVPDLGESGQEYNFYARYIPKVYILYYYYPGFEYDSHVTYNEPYRASELDSDPNPREGYTWLGWYDADSGGNRITSTSTVKVLTTNNYFYVYPRWRKDPIYTITFSDTKGNDTTRVISAPQDYKVDPLPSATANGFVFQGWYTKTSGGTRITINTVFNANTTVYAQWKPIYTITFNGRGGTSPSSQPVYLEDGYKLTSLPSSTRTNYDFQGWYTATSGGTRITISTVFSANTTVYAQWKGEAYIVQFYSNGGEAPSLPSKTVYFGEAYGALATVSRSGYGFVGWFNSSSSSSGTQITPSTVVTASTPKKLYARWAIKTYTVVFKDWDGSVLKTQSVPYGGSATPPSDPTRPQNDEYTFTFISWTGTYTNITDSVIIYAYYTANKRSYNVTFKDWNQSVLKTQSVLYGGSATPPSNPTRPQNDESTFAFSGWVGTYTDITGPATIYADYTATKRKYTITWSGGAGSTLDYSTSSVEHGTIPTPPGGTKTGYNLTGWSPTRVAVTGATTYTATWTIKTYTVRFFNYNSDQIGNTQTINHGSSATAPADPTKPQTTTHTYTFSGWNKEFTNVTQNLDITATYTSASRKYTITWIWNNGTGFLTTKQENYGADPTPPSLPRAGYTLSGWTPTIVPVLGEATYTAKWTVIQYNINYILNGGINVSGNPSTYNVETPLITFLPPTKTGYDFISWSTTNIPKGSTGDKTTTASWKFINVPNLNSIANDCAFNSSDQYLVVAHETTPYVTIYKKGTNDTFSKMNLTAPPGKAESCAFSPDGKYLAIGHQIAPGLTIYKKGTGDNFTKLTINSIEQNTALSCTFSKDSKYLAVTHLNAPHVTIYETGQGQTDIFTKMNALSSPDGNQGSGSSSSFSNENEYLAITYNNSPYVAVIKAQRNPNEKHTYLLNNSFSTVSTLLDTPLIELGYARDSGSPLQNNKRVKLIWK